MQVNQKLKKIIKFSLIIAGSAGVLEHCDWFSNKESMVLGGTYRITATLTTQDSPNKLQTLKHIRAVTIGGTGIMRKHPNNGTALFDSMIQLVAVDRNLDTKKIEKALKNPKWSLQLGANVAAMQEVLKKCPDFEIAIYGVVGDNVKPESLKTKLAITRPKFQKANAKKNKQEQEINKQSQSQQMGKKEFYKKSLLSFEYTPFLGKEANKDELPLDSQTPAAGFKKVELVRWKLEDIQEWLMLGKGWSDLLINLPNGIKHVQLVVSHSDQPNITLISNNNNNNNLQKKVLLYTVFEDDLNRVKSQTITVLQDPMDMEDEEADEIKQDDEGNEY